MCFEMKASKQAGFKNHLENYDDFFDVKKYFQKQFQGELTPGYVCKCYLKRAKTQANVRNLCDI